VFDGCGDGIRGRGGIAMAANIVLNGGSSGRELKVCGGIRQWWWTTKMFFDSGGERGHSMTAAIFNGGIDGHQCGSRGKEEDTDTTIK
jgi:hypothetical protein